MKKVGADVVSPSMYKSMYKGADDPMCWSCHQATDMPQCLACGKIQPPSQNDYFELFTLPASFRIDLDYLEKKYLQLQQQVHPDRFVGQSIREKRYASQQSSLLNQAYEVLKDPIQRGHYLLQIMDKSYQEHADQGFQDQDFLMMLLMEQEVIEGTIDPEHLQESLKNYKEKLRAYEDMVRQAFDDKNLEAALAYLNRYQYQQTLLSKAMQKLNQIRN